MGGGRDELHLQTNLWEVGMLVPWGQLGLALGQHHTLEFGKVLLFVSL